MKHYLFECVMPGSDNEGEEFIVGANSYAEAKDIAIDNFGLFKFLGEISEEEAEASGLDEY